MPVVDGATYPLNYAQERCYNKRAQIFKPSYPVLLGNPQGQTWELVVENCPFYHKQARGLDEAFPIGRVDQDLTFTTEVLHFPLDANVDQGYWVRDVSRNSYPDGPKHRNYGRFYVCRGNPSWFEPVEGVPQGYQIFMGSIEASPPPGIQAIIDVLEAEP